MKKSMIMIRNITAPTPDEMELILAPAGLLDKKLPEDTPEVIQKLQAAHQTSLLAGTSAAKQAATQEMRGLMQRTDVRDYLYEKIKESTGNHVILHLNHDSKPPEDAADYIIHKLNTIQEHSHANVFYLGGGHGGGREGRVDDETSGLKKESVLQILQVLNEKGIKTDAVICGSCYSGAFSNHLRSILPRDGIMLSDSIECGSDNNFTPVMRWINDLQNNDFFLPEEISASRVPTREQVDKLQELSGFRLEQEDVRSYSDAIVSAGPSATREDLARITELHPAIQTVVDDMRSKCVFEADFAQFQTALCSEIQTFVAGHPEVARAIENASTAETSLAQARRDTKQRLAVEHGLKSTDRRIKGLTENDPVVTEAKRVEAESAGVCKGIRATLISTLEEKFQSPQEKNFLKIYYESAHEDLQEHLSCANPGANFEILLNYYKDNPTSGGVRVYLDEEQLYRRMQSAVQQAVLTGRIISGPSTSRLLQLDESTGKPSYACHDAFELNKKVIGILRAGDGITVIEEDDLQTFNQASVMSAFNTGFRAAIATSAAVANATPATIEPSNPSIDLEKCREIRDKFHHAAHSPEQKTTQLGPDDITTDVAPGNTLGS